MVTGGRVSYSNYLDSTELLLPSATSWTYSAALPSPRSRLRGATLNNKVVVTGTNIDTLVTRDCLLMICVFTNTIISSDNITHCTAGGNYGGTYGDTLDDILEFNAEDGTWSRVGSMVNSRGYHAVSVINYLEHRGEWVTFG